MWRQITMVAGFWIPTIFLTETAIGIVERWKKSFGWPFCSRVQSCNRPLALRGHVTNASFKQRVGILLMPKIDRGHKNYLTPEIWEETQLREIFYGSLILQQSSMICMMLEGILLPSNMATKTSFCLDLVKRLIVTLRCAVNVPTFTFLEV